MRLPVWFLYADPMVRGSRCARDLVGAFDPGSYNSNKRQV